jgi:ectoine hydroxylase-related dioxygenase (phytanoyl-CoA dioxygenase family)
MFAVNDTYHIKHVVCNNKKRLQLRENGIVIMKSFIKNEDIEKIKEFIKNDKPLDVKTNIIGTRYIQDNIKEILGKDYIFHDYIFLIKKSQFHTCHRDYNGDLFNKEQKYPSYTIIIYLEDMNKCLDVIPKSHKSLSHNYNFSDYSQTILCKKGDAILFNANLVHNGSVNENENNMRVQMKLSHQMDMETLDFYNNYNKILNSENKSPMFVKHVQKHISCQFPIISHIVREYDHNAISGDAEATSVVSSLFAKLDTINE